MPFLEAEEKVVASPEDTKKNETGSNCGLGQKNNGKDKEKRNHPDEELESSWGCLGLSTEKEVETEWDEF